MSVLVVLLVVVSCAGCGGKSVDQVLAESAVLRSSDLPSTGPEGLSWHVDTSADADETVVGLCVKLDFPGFVLTGDARSGWFYSGTSQVTSYSGVYEDSADEALGQLADDATQCIREERSAETGIVGLLVGEAKVREVSFPRMGESSRAFEIKYGLGPLAAYDDIVLTHKGRSIVLLYVALDELTLDVADRLMVELSRAVASRM